MKNWIKNLIIIVLALVFVWAIVHFFRYDNKLLLEYLKVILTWPVMMFFVILTIAMIFNEPISKWLSGLKIDYRGASLSSSQSQAKPDESISTSMKINNGKDNSKNMLPELQKESEEDFRALAQQWRASAYIWEYRYLNYYLVFNTKRALYWLFTFNRPFNIEVADSLWRSIVSNPNERIAILNALKQHYLVVENNRAISITEKGKEYAELMLKPIFG